MSMILTQATTSQIYYGLGLHLMNYTNPVTLHTLTPVIPVRAISCGCPYNIVASKGRRKTSHYDKKVYQKYNFTLTPVITDPSYYNFTLTPVIIRILSEYAVDSLLVFSSAFQADNSQQYHLYVAKKTITLFCKARSFSSLYK